MTDYVSYLRVSTSKQQRTGLGLSAQRSSIFSFLGEDDAVIAEFVETASGAKNERHELEKALRVAKQRKAKLLIAKLDRFSRKVSFISGIMDEGVGLVVADMPNATDFQLHIFAALAQEERRLISERTRAALAQAKLRGVELGKNGRLLAKTNKLAADRFAHQMAPLLLPLIDSGFSYSQIACRLNEAGHKTSSGRHFYAQTVINLYRRLRQP